MKKDTTTSTELKLVPGSLYSKDNAAFVYQTMARAEKLYSSILNDPALKKKPIKKNAEQLFNNMLELMLTINGRKTATIEKKKRENAADEYGFIHNNEASLEEMALINIASEDLIHAIIVCRT